MTFPIPRNFPRFVYASGTRLSESGVYTYTGSTAANFPLPDMDQTPRVQDWGLYLFKNEGTGVATITNAAATTIYTNAAVSTLAVYPGDGYLIQGNNLHWSIIAAYTKGFVTSTVASGSAVSLTSATGANVTSISLPAGDWDISAQVDFALTGATSTSHQSGISLTSATLPTQAGGSGLGTDALAILPMPTTGLSGTLTQAIAQVRLLISATTTVYLVAQAAFSVGSESAYGTIRARRV